MTTPEISITIPEIVNIHDTSLARFGGLAGLRLEGCLEQIHGNAMMAEQYSGNEDGTLGLCFIGSIMFYLIKNQCFLDGNKRTGLGVALELLARLGMTLDIDPIELKEYCETVAIDTRMESGDVVKWLAERIIQNEPKGPSEEKPVE